MTWITRECQSGLVSVIIPTYNREALIIETLNSIANQTYLNIECIIVDDGSTDNTKQTVENYIAENKSHVHFRYIFQKNNGAQSARNNGTLHATGEYFQYLDSDDILFPAKIESQINYLIKNPSCIAVYSNWSTGTPSNNRSFDTGYYNSFTNAENYILNKPIANFALIMHRDAVIKTGSWDEQLTTNEEVDYHIRFLLTGYRIEYLDINCGIWRDHDGERLSKSINLENTKYYFKKIENLIKNAGLWNLSISEQLGTTLMWVILNRDISNKKLQLELLVLASTYNTHILPFKSYKTKLLQFLFNKKIALRYWLKIWMSNS